MNQKNENTESKTKQIPLTQGYFAIVDEEDFERLNKYKWHARKYTDRIYAVRTHEVGRAQSMHRLIMCPPTGLVVDHINHDCLDNRKCNLRICSPAENSRNRRPNGKGSSKYKGVTWDKEKKKWKAQINYNGQHIFLGLYDYQEDAALAYDAEALVLFCEFACLNFDHYPPLLKWYEDSYLYEMQFYYELENGPEHLFKNYITSAKDKNKINA
jgi:hypothetical protein